MSNSLWPHGLQHASLLCPSLSPGTCSNSCPLSAWCHPIISSSVAPFSSCPQSFPASESFAMSRLFASGGQRIGASASVLPMSFQGWFLLGVIGLILQSKGLSRVFSSTTVWKHQFFSTQSSNWIEQMYSIWIIFSGFWAIKSKRLWTFLDMSFGDCVHMFSCCVTRLGHWVRICSP